MGLKQPADIDAIKLFFIFLDNNRLSESDFTPFGL